MTKRLAYFAAAATLIFAGTALAQTPPSAPAGSPAQAPASQAPASQAPASQAPASQAPAARAPAQDATPAEAPAGQSSPTTSGSAEAAATPSSATIAGDVQPGAQVKDPAGLVVGTVENTTTGPDGSANVVVNSGGKKFALPKASLTMSGGSVSTTATKAQIDAALAGAKP